MDLCKCKSQTKKNVERIAKNRKKNRILGENPVIVLNESVPLFVAAFINILL
jgi:hypothetical protein